MLGATVWLYHSHAKTTLGARAGIGWPEPGAQVTQDSAQDTLSIQTNTGSPNGLLDRSWDIQRKLSH